MLAQQAGVTYSSSPATNEASVVSQVWAQQRPCMPTDFSIAEMLLRPTLPQTLVEPQLHLLSSRADILTRPNVDIPLTVFLATA